MCKLPETKQEKVWQNGRKKERNLYKDSIINKKKKKTIDFFGKFCYNENEILGKNRKVGKKEMNIGFIAHNSKKTLMENFCLAYKYILSKHHLYATGITGRRIEEVTNLKVYKFLPEA